LELEDGHPSRKYGTSPPCTKRNPLDFVAKNLIAQPIKVGNYFDAVFSFLDERHFVIPSVLAERSNEILLNVYRLCPRPQPGQQQQASPSLSPPGIIRSYALSVSDVLEDICTLRFFPDVSARGGTSPGHFYADASRRVFGIQIEATFRSTKQNIVQELLVPVQALKASMRSPVYRSATVRYEPFIGRRLAYASRAAEGKIPLEKLPAVLREVGAFQLRYAVCCGALFVFEVRCGHSLLCAASTADFLGILAC
jgi:hypothetical protein